MTGPMLAVEGLTVGDAAAPILHAVDLTVASGEVVALIGANGAGKTTLLSAIMGFRAVVAGRILLDGADITGLPIERRARRGLAYVPEGRRVFPGMTVRDTLEVASRASAAERARAVERIFDLFPQLAGKSRERAWRLSGGQQQMLSLGRALMAEPRLLILDEPSLGLSPRVVTELFEKIGHIAAAGTAVLIAEQRVPQALALADRVLLLASGRIVRTGDPSAFTRAALAAAMLGQALAGDGGDR